VHDFDTDRGMADLGLARRPLAANPDRAGPLGTAMMPSVRRSARIAARASAVMGLEVATRFRSGSRTVPSSSCSLSCRHLESRRHVSACRSRMKAPTDWRHSPALGTATQYAVSNSNVSGRRRFCVSHRLQRLGVKVLSRGGGRRGGSATRRDGDLPSWPIEIPTIALQKARGHVTLT